MDVLYKVFIGVLGAVVLVGCGLGVTSGFASAVASDNYMESVAKVIVDSNYNENVIETCKAEALENGYVLTVNVQGSNKNGVKKCAEIELKYYFEIKLFGIKEEKVQKKVI